MPPLLLAVPALLFLAVYFGVPLLQIAAQSIGIGDDHIGLESYVEFLTDPIGLQVLIRTLITAIAITAICVVLGYPYAYLMTVAGPRARTLMMVAVLVPFWSSVMVRTFAWLILLGESGPINSFLVAFGIGPVPLVRNLVGAIIGMVHIMLPFMVLPMYATMRAVDRRLLVAAQTLGARPASAFFRVYLPLSLPGVYAGSVVVLMLSLGFFVTPAVLGSPKESLLSQLIVARALQVLDLKLAGTMAVVLLAAALIVLALFSRLVRPDAAYRAGVER
jgi:putative spermidine/putrescine transport system permease protein